MKYSGTNIDGVFIDPDRLEVRNVDLVEIISNFSYCDAIAHILAGDGSGGVLPFNLSTAFATTLQKLPADWAAFELIRTTRRGGGNCIQAVTAALMVKSPATLDPAAADALGLDEDQAEALALIAALPVLVAAASEAEDDAVLQRAQTDDASSYMTRLHRLFVANPTGEQTKVLERVLTAWHGGFGYLPPSIMLPRISIGTGVAYRQAIGAGFAAGGPMHIGATEFAVPMISGILAHAPSHDQIPAVAKATVAKILAEHGRLPGFGHPLFVKDPRPDALMAAARPHVPDHPALMAFDALRAEAKAQAEVEPNIDSASAALFIAAGVTSASAAAALSLSSRAAGMLAHMIERKNKPAFGVNSKTAREYLQTLPKDWL